MSVRILQYLAARHAIISGPKGGKREEAAMSVKSDSCGSAMVYVESASSLSGPSPKLALRSHDSNLYKINNNILFNLLITGRGGEWGGGKGGRGGGRAVYFMLCK